MERVKTEKNWRRLTHYRGEFIHAINRASPRIVMLWEKTIFPRLTQLLNLIYRLVFGRYAHASKSNVLAHPKAPGQKKKDVLQEIFDKIQYFPVARMRETRSKDTQLALVHGLIDFFREQGLVNLLPLPWESKGPPLFDWKSYQTIPYPQEKLLTEIEAKSGEINMAVVCGASNKNLVVVDLDKSRAEDVKQILLSEIPELQRTFIVQTGSGAYHLYVFVDILPRTTRLNFHGTDFHLDIQSQGTYVVAPTGKHPNGSFYKDISNKAPIARLRGDVVQRIIDVLKKRGYKFKEIGSISVKELLRGLDQGMRNEACIRLATWLRIQGKSQEEAVAFLRAWNKKNQPPLDESELLTTIDSAYSPEEPYGYRFEEMEEVFDPEIESEAERLSAETDLIPRILEGTTRHRGDDHLKVVLAILNLVKESIAILGKSASGKNSVMEAVLNLFPKGSYIKITGGSERAIRYLKKNIRTLYLAEKGATRQGYDGESLMEYDIKLTISEGKLSIIVVEKNPEGALETKFYETELENVLMTTTEVQLTQELQNRLWEVNTELGAEHYEAVAVELMSRQEQEPSKRPTNEREGKILRCYLEKLEREAPQEFVIPYVSLFKEMFSYEDPRIHRDIQKFFKLIHGFALLHYQNRPKFTDGDGREVLICLPIDAYNALTWGREALFGTMTLATPMAERYFELCQELKKRGKALTSKNLASVARISVNHAGRWLKRLSEELGWLVEKDSSPLKQGGRIKVYACLDELPKRTWRVSMRDLWQRTVEWLREENVPEPTELATDWPEEIVVEFPERSMSMWDNLVDETKLLGNDDEEPRLEKWKNDTS